MRRRVTEGTLDAARVPEILKRVVADRAYWTLVEVGTEVLGAAEKLVAVHPFGRSTPFTWRQPRYSLRRVRNLI